MDDFLKAVANNLETFEYLGNDYETRARYLIRIFRTLVQRNSNGTLADHSMLQKYIDEALK